MNKEKILTLCKDSVQRLEEIWTMIMDAEMQNDQEVLDWLDKINEISTRN